MDRTITRTPADDYRLLRESALPLDLSSWCVIRVVGPEARDFLQGMATQDVASPTQLPDRAAATLFLTEKGRPVALAWVAIELDGSAAWVIADEGARTTLRPHFEKFRIMEDVEFEGPDRMPPVLGVAGPRRATRLSALATEYRGARALHAEPLSFVLLGRGAIAEEALPHPVAAPTITHATALPEAEEAWRLSVGLPRAGVDFDLDRIATELSLPEAISDTKGCYVGQEVVARTSNRGQVRRRRVGFRFPWDGTRPPFRAELLAQGVPVGYLTSAAPEPGSGDGLGMGYITVESIDTGARITISGRDAPITIASWPL
jgi:folate-binding protein YgfZ